MRRSACRELLQCSQIATDEGLFLGPAPLLELALILDGVRDPIEPSREKKCDGSSCRGVAAECTGVVLGYSDFERSAGYSNIETPIRAAQDVEKSSFRHAGLPSLACRSP